MTKTEKRADYRYGFRKGLPIGAGYITVSFAFGVMAVGKGLTPLLAVFISLTNLTSAGQFAGTNLLVEGAGILEIALTVFVINLRYMLMSLALSQKLQTGTGLFKRLVFGFGITDETFAVAVTETHKISAEYLFGLITAPIIGWTFGTALGAFASGILPPALQSAMGIALYAMFIAIIVPPAKKSKPVVFVLALSILLSCTLHSLRIFDFISDGFQIIISTVLSAAAAALLFPVENKE